MSRYRNWCGTYFNIERDGLTGFSDLFKRSEVKLFVGQLEECPDTQRLHVQFYTEFVRPFRLSRLKNLFPDTIHWERRRGSRAQAIAYCQKDESRLEGPVVIGDLDSAQGKRTDLEDACTSLTEHRDLKRLAEDMPTLFVKYHKGFSALLDITTSERSWKTLVTVVIGEPGVGKTYWVHSKCEPGSVFHVCKPNNNTVWWDGYNPEKHTNVLFDDFYGWVPYVEMLRLMDEQAHQVPVKGGFKNFLAKHIYITSNSHWDHWYDWHNPNMRKAAWERRVEVTKIVESREDFNEVVVEDV